MTYQIIRKIFNKFCSFILHELSDPANEQGLLGRHFADEHVGDAAVWCHDVDVNSLNAVTNCLYVNIVEHEVADDVA